MIKTRDQLIQQDKMAALGRMASGIAHEIRNPLEIIYMGIDYLENNIAHQDPQIDGSIEKIYKAANRADNIINNILSFPENRNTKLRRFRSANCSTTRWCWPIRPFTRDMSL